MIFGWFRRKPLLDVIEVPDKGTAVEEVPKTTKRALQMVRSASGETVASLDTYSKLVSPTLMQTNIASVFQEGNRKKLQYSLSAFKTATRGSDAETKSGLFRSSHYIYGKPTNIAIKSTNLRIPLTTFVASELVEECLEFAASFGFTCNEQDTERLLEFYNLNFKREAQRMVKGKKGNSITFCIDFWMPPPYGGKTHLNPALLLSIYSGLPIEGGWMPSDAVTLCQTAVNLTKTRESTTSLDQIKPGKDDDDDGAQLIEMK